MADALVESFGDKVWKNRLEAYQKAQKWCETSECDESSEWDILGSSLAKVCSDANAACLDAGLQLTLTWLDYCPEDVSPSKLGKLSAALRDKGFGARPNTRQAAIDCCLGMIEVFGPDHVLPEMFEGLKHKRPQIVAVCIRTLNDSLSSFGHPVINVAAVTAKCAPLFSHSDRTVRAEDCLLFVECLKWDSKATDKRVAELRPAQQKEIREAFEEVDKSTVVERSVRVAGEPRAQRRQAPEQTPQPKPKTTPKSSAKASPKPKQPATTTPSSTRVETEVSSACPDGSDSKPKPKPKAPTTKTEGSGVTNKKQTKPPQSGAVEDHIEDIDWAANQEEEHFVEVADKITEAALEEMQSKNWRVRFEKLQWLSMLLSHPHLAQGDYKALMGVLTKICLKDANVNVVVECMRCIGLLSRGVGLPAKSLALSSAPAIMSRLKEKKQNVVNEAQIALRLIVVICCSSELSPLVEVLGKNVAEQQKNLLIWLSELLWEEGINMDDANTNTLMKSLLKCANGSNEQVREASFSAIAAITMQPMKNKSVQAQIDALGKVKLAKIEELKAKNRKRQSEIEGGECAFEELIDSTFGLWKFQQFHKEFVRAKMEAVEDTSEVVEADPEKLFRTATKLRIATNVLAVKRFLKKKLEDRKAREQEGEREDEENEEEDVEEGDGGQQDQPEQLEEEASVALSEQESGGDGVGQNTDDASLEEEVVQEETAEPESSANSSEKDNVNVAREKSTDRSGMDAAVVAPSTQLVHARAVIDQSELEDAVQAALGEQMQSLRDKFEDERQEMEEKWKKLEQQNRELRVALEKSREIESATASEAAATPFAEVVGEIEKLKLCNEDREMIGFVSVHDNMSIEDVRTVIDQDLEWETQDYRFSWDNCPIAPKQERLLKAKSLLPVATVDFSSANESREGRSPASSGLNGKPPESTKPWDEKELGKWTASDVEDFFHRMSTSVPQSLLGCNGTQLADLLSIDASIGGSTKPHADALEDAGRVAADLERMGMPSPSAQRCAQQLTLHTITLYTKSSLLSAAKRVSSPRIDRDALTPAHLEERVRALEILTSSVIEEVKGLQLWTQQPSTPRSAVHTDLQQQLEERRRSRSRSPSSLSLLRGRDSFSLDDHLSKEEIINGQLSSATTGSMGSTPTHPLRPVLVRKRTDVDFNSTFSLPEAEIPPLDLSQIDEAY